MGKALKVVRLRGLQVLLSVASRLAPRLVVQYLGKLFVTPDPSTYRHAKSRLASLEDVQRSRIQLDGEWIETYAWGDPSCQPFVLISHGWSSYALRFTSWVPHLLALGYAVVCFDQVGHGLSTGRVSHLARFTSVLRQIGRRFGQPSVLIGHSLGASAAVFAREDGATPLRYVLIAPMLAAEEGTRRHFRELGISPKVFALFEEWVHQLTGQRFSDYDASDYLKNRVEPALIIHDRQDRVTPWEEGARFADLWPDAQLYSTDGFGHNRMVDHSTVISEAMRFIGKAMP